MWPLGVGEPPKQEAVDRSTVAGRPLVFDAKAPEPDRELIQTIDDYVEKLTGGRGAVRTAASEIEIDRDGWRH